MAKKNYDTQKIKNLIQLGRTEKAIEELVKIGRVSNKELENEIILISAQFYKHKKEKSLGLINGMEIGNQINLSILYILNTLDQLKLKQTKRKVTQSKMYDGVIIRVLPDFKYGFIKSNRFKGNIFFHFSSITNKTLVPKENNHVKFLPINSVKGVFSEKTIISKKRKPKPKPNPNKDRKPPSNQPSKSNKQNKKIKNKNKVVAKEKDGCSLLLLLFIIIFLSFSFIWFI